MRTTIFIFIAVLLVGLFSFPTLCSDRSPVDDEREKNTAGRKAAVSVSVADNETVLKAENKEPDRGSIFSSFSTLVIVCLGLLFLLRIRFRLDL